MPNDKDMKTVLRKVSLQREEMRNALSNLYERLRHGVFNGIFPDKCKRAHISGDKCKKGFSREDVLWRMGGCCADCEGIGECCLSFEEKDVFDAMRKAVDALSKPFAEMPEIKPECFEKYVHGDTYNKTPRWIARQLYKFSVGYWGYADHSNVDSEKAWERAFDDTICISLDSVGGKGYALRKFLGLVEDGSLEGKKAEEYFASDPDGVKSVMEESMKHLESKVESESDVKILVYHAIVLRMEFQFAHKYPGADMAVYSGVFDGLINDCLAVAGIACKDFSDLYDEDNPDAYERNKLQYEEDRREKLFDFMVEED